MVDYMLKFDSKEHAETVLVALEFLADYDGQIGPGPLGSTDIIGPIFKDGVQLEGYHVNIRTNTIRDELEQYRVFPSTPVRVWA